MIEGFGARYPSLVGRRVVITGGGTGIGAALVEGFFRQHSRVHFLDIQDVDSRALVDALPGPARPSFHLCDLTNPDAISKTFNSIGDVDILVNNAGNDDRHALSEVNASYFDERVAVNLRHYILCARAVAPSMARLARGVIINIGSVAWRRGLPNLSVYDMAKAGAEGLTRGLARELGPDGVRVVCIAPGAVVTPRQLKWSGTPEVEAGILAAECLKARIQPPDVAAMALFLASDDARFCTGQTYLVDAGWS